MPEIPPYWPETTPIANPMQNDDTPYAGSAIYWIEHGKVQEGGLLNKEGIEGKFLLVVERYSRRYCFIKTEHASLLHPTEDSIDEWLGFSKMLKNDGTYKKELCYKAGETFEQAWFRIARLQTKTTS